MGDGHSGSEPCSGSAPGKGGTTDTGARGIHPAQRIAVSLAIPLLALAVQWSLWDYFKPYVWFLFFPAAFFSAWVGGLVGGLAGTVLSILLVWYFFMPPALSFELEQPSSGYSIAVFMLMGGLFSLFHERLQRSMRRVRGALEEARKAQESMARLYRETVEADGQKSRFFARISHQLRTPLTLILAPLERRLAWKAGDVLADADCRETEGMLRNARLLHRYVIDLLDAARIEARQMTLSYTRVDLVPFFRSMASHFEPIATKRGIRYEVSAPDALLADADVAKLQRVLVELLSNAFKYTPDGGAVALRLAQTDGEVLIEVQDGGAVVPAELRDAVFERFPAHEGDSVRRPSGSGLGLSIAKDFVELHGGTISLDDAPGGGMLFSIGLPGKLKPGEIATGASVADESLARRAVEELESDVVPSFAQASERGSDAPLVLVVEDDPWMNEFICSTLGARYRVCPAFDGVEGADKALTLQPDLIVTDLMMPVMRGEEMVAKLRRQAATADIPILVISAGGDEKTRLELIGSSVQDYLSKPFSTVELLARVDGLVKSRRKTLAELARSTARLRRLAEVVERIAAVHDLPSLMSIVRRAVRELTGADGTTLVMRDNGHCHYVEEDAIGPLWKGQRFPLEECISGWTMLNAQSAVIEDIYADPRIPHAAYRPTFVKSLSMVPIGRVEPVGAIGSYWATRHKASEEELELQQALADAMSVGLANLELYKAMEDARREAEQSAAATRESEKRFRQLFQEAPVALCLLDRDGVLADFNGRFEQMFGYGRADVPTLAEWWSQAYPDGVYRAEVTAAWNAAVASASRKGGNIGPAENLITCKDGRVRVVLVSGIALGDNMLTTFFDITERRQAEVSLRRQTDELIRRNEELERFNRASIGRELEMIKLKQQVNKLSIETGRPPPYSLTFLDETEESVGKGDLAVVEDIEARKEAESALAQSQSLALEGREQARLAALNQMEDAIVARTGAEKANAALRESEARLQLFIEHAPAALAMFDRDMRYVAVSRRWLDDYALTERNVIGVSHYEVLPEIPERWRELHRRGMAGEVLQSDEDPFTREDGSVQWLRWEILPWYSDGGEVGGIVIFSEDITRYKRAEEEIRCLNADLERRVLERTAELTAANRELDSFAYAVSHDLRAPLRAMNGFALALNEEYGDRLDGEGAIYLEQIGIASRKMSELIEGILALSRSTRGELQRDVVDVSALSTSILAELQRSDPERRVEIRVEPGLSVHGDARMIESVMRNLLGNAWKYTGKTPAPVIGVHSGLVDGASGIYVTDNGDGFDMSHAEQLFQPFRRLHRQDEFPGIGIGLATVQRIVHRHGGKILASASPGRGATFCFSLAGEEGAAR